MTGVVSVITAPALPSPDMSTPETFSPRLSSGRGRSRSRERKKVHKKIKKCFKERM